MEDIRKAVLSMCRANLDTRKNEKVLVMTDSVSHEKNFMEKCYATEKDIKGIKDTEKLAKEVYRIIKEEYPHTDFLAYEATGSHGKEPDKKTAERMKGHNVIIILSHYSMTHTDARQQASKEGARIASMPGFQRGMFFKNGPMGQDYKVIDDLSRRLAAIVAKTSRAEITADNGTVVHLELGNDSVADLGVIKRGKCSNLPAGEVYTVPKGGKGRLVISKGWFEGIKEDLIFNFGGGLLLSMEGGGEIGDKLRKKLFEKRHRRVLAEFGIGTNPGAGNPTNVLESEKIMGTIHIAFGDSSHMPGGDNTSDSHIDFILDKPTVKFDGKIFIDKGKMLV